jgi:L-ascorbate metabolism protein UlaG (beta-lactamase superfamily)
MGPRLVERFTAEAVRPIEPPPLIPNPGLWDDFGLHSAWLGHSTVLLKIEGTTVLTDPVFSDRAGVDLGITTIGPKRIVAPALRMNQLPRPDVILLSHAHMDHFDLPSLAALRNPKTTVVTASKTADLLSGKRYAAVHELGWGEQVRVGNLTIRAFEVRHWGARVQTDTFRGYNGYLIESPRYRVLFGGDTALTDTFRHLKTARGIDLAIMPVGAYDPWLHAHCNPEQALHMANQAGAEAILPVHHKTFVLSNEPWGDPLHRLEKALGADLRRLALRDIGGEFSFR